MSAPYGRFSGNIQRAALARQKFKCGSCGTMIVTVGEVGKSQHQFRERAEGHHIIPNIDGGPPTEDNCVILCRACHLNAHQGGQWKDVSIYADTKNLPIRQRIASISKLYPHYRG